MTDQPDPSVKSGAHLRPWRRLRRHRHPHPRCSSNRRSTPSHAAPGPLFLDQHDNLESEPQELEERPAPPPERTAEPLSMTKSIR